MHLLEISIFSLNNDLVRLIKFMTNLVKDLKILSFKVIFQSIKFYEEYLIVRPTVKMETRVLFVLRTLKQSDITRMINVIDSPYNM